MAPKQRSSELGKRFNSYLPHSEEPKSALLRRSIRTSISELSEISGQFDSIIVRGVSGIMVGAPVAAELEKELVVIRKTPGMAGRASNAHGYAIESYIGSVDPERALWLDDFVRSGGTHNAVMEQLGARTALVYLYALNCPPFRTGEGPENFGLTQEGPRLFRRIKSWIQF